MPATKADKAEIAKQVEQAFIALLDGYRSPQVVRTLMAEHGIGQTQAYERVKEALAEIYRKREEKFDQSFEKHYKRLERLYNLCLKNGDRKTANSVLKQMSELLGLEAPKRTDITSGGEKITPQFVDVLGMGGHIVEPREVIKTEPKPAEEPGEHTENNEEASSSTGSDSQ